MKRTPPTPATSSGAGPEPVSANWAPPAVVDDASSERSVNADEAGDVSEDDVAATANVVDVVELVAARGAVVEVVLDVVVVVP